MVEAGAVVVGAVMVVGAAVTVLVVAVTDSVVVMHLADSPPMVLVRDSAGHAGFLLVDFLIAEITAALLTAIFVDGITIFADTIATFAIVASAILMGTFSVSEPPDLDIRIITTTTHIPTTTTMRI
jgi:hypothetical protein